MTINKQIISKDDSPEGYRTTKVHYLCEDCGATWYGTYRGVWDGKVLCTEKVVEELGQPCGCPDEAH